MNKRIKKKHNRPYDFHDRKYNPFITMQIMVGFRIYAPWVSTYDAAKATKDYVRKAKYIRNDGSDWVYEHGGYTNLAQEVAITYGLATSEEIDKQIKKNYNLD